MIPRFHQHRVCEQSLRIAETASLACHAFFALALDFLFRQECSPLTSCSIGQAFALRADQQRGRAFGVVQASLNPASVKLLLSLAVVVAEIKLRTIALQMLRADMMESANDAALEYGEKPFDGVRMRIAAHVFPVHVVNRVVALE